MDKRVVLTCAVAMASLTLSGCSATLRTFVNSGLQSQVDARVNENIACVEQLKTAGLLSSDKAEDIKDNIKGNGQYLKRAFQQLSSNASSSWQGSDVMKAATGIAKYGDCEANVLAYARETDTIGDDDDSVDADELMLGNYILANGYSTDESIGWEEKYGWFVRDNGGTDESTGAIRPINPVDLVSLDEDDLEISDNFKVYVLDPEKIASHNFTDTGKAMDNIKEIFDTYVDSSGKLTEEASSYLDGFYSEVDGISLFDGFDATCLIGTTKTQDGGHLTAGYDMQIMQGGLGVIRIRLNEFNQEAVDNLCSMVSSSNGKYILNAKTGKAYLVEYPVEVINEMYTTNGTDVSASLTQSDIAVNVKSGEIIKYVDVDGQAMPDRYTIGSNIENYTSYLGTYGSDNENGSACSSFALLGSQQVTIEANYIGQQTSEVTSTRNITTAGIVLRDYLETSYAPGYLDTSKDLVVFGRKFRFNITGIDSSGELQLKYDNIAAMVDINGEAVLDSDGNAIQLDADDIMTIRSDIAYSDRRDNDSYFIERLRKAGETDGQIVQERATTQSNPPKIAELRIRASEKISPIERFPSERLDAGDYEESPTQPVMYAFGTCTDLFEKGLYASWISSSSPTSSLSWWTQWLSSVGYSYGTTAQSVEDYLAGNYSYELQQQGVVMIDLDTVAMIQNDIDILNNERNNATRRTLFKVMGIALIAYGIILMLCWTIDTQVGLGLDLYKIASFGRWQAMKYKSDIPTGEKLSKYVALGRMLLNSIIIISIGTVIIRLNVVNVLYRIVGSFGKLAEYIMGNL